MADTLIIVESPTKARTLERFLGPGFRVVASGGHVRDLPRSKLGIDIEADFEPDYITIRGKGKMLETLRRAAAKSGTVLLATDPDREGEAISWHLAHALGLDQADSCRIVFHEITDRAVSKALESPRPVDLSLVDAQQARRVLDRLVGYKLSPLLWRKVRRGLSAGRVQSVALRLVVDREAEIDAFQPEEYWHVTATLATELGESFEARYRGSNGEKVGLTSGEQARQLVHEIEGMQFSVATVTKRTRKRNPAPSFTTSTLQQEAYRKLGFGVRKTMRVAQQLYEGVPLSDGTSTGLITYMRSDSTRVGGTAMEGARQFITARFGAEYSQPRAKGKASKEAQDAHEAIRPTDVQLEPGAIKRDLSSDQHRLYQLIWARFVASQMAPARLEGVTADIAVANHSFRATGSVVLFPGFLKVYVEGSDEGNALNGEKVLPQLVEGQNLLTEQVRPSQHFTQPPARYTEASLVRALEENGVGRPSTYAPTVETIQSRRYVTVDDKKLVPTDLGKVVTQLLRENFPQVVDVDFTAGMERELDRVEEGDRQWRELIGEFYAPFKEMLERAEDSIERVQLPVEHLDEPCPECGTNLIIREGRFGRFIGCPAYPECKYTRPYLESTGVECPVCGMDMVVRRSRRGRTFYGCAGYPDCDFTSWQKPTARKCPICDSFMVQRRLKSGKTYYACAAPGCHQGGGAEGQAAEDDGQ